MEARKQRFYEAHKNADYILPDTVPDSIKHIITKGMDPDPAKRYQSMDEMLSDMLDAYYEPTTNPKTEAEARAESEQRFEGFVNGWSKGRDRFKPQAIAEGKTYLASSEAGAVGVEKAEQALENFWDFYIGYAQDKLRVDDSSVGNDLKTEILPYAQASVSDAQEQQEIVQIVGKFFVNNPTYQTNPDQIQLLVRAYKAVDNVI
jgi:hypothetical protein